MDYAQITMDEYLGLKKDIHESIGKIVKNFVRIGKTLYQIEQSEAYKLDGYKTLAEFARAEYDMKPGGVSRFVGVYRKYCDGDGLKQGYEDYTYAQLVEMLNLPEEDEALIRPDTSREGIRDLKRFNKEGKNDIHALESWKEPEEEEHEKYLKEMLVILFKKKDRESDFNAICEGLRAGDMSAESFSEYVNPGGNKTIRNGRTMTFLFENEIRMKIWGEDRPAVFSYEQLEEAFREQFQGVLEESAGWWKKQFEPEDKTDTGAGKDKIAPAQKEEIGEPEKASGQEGKTSGQSAAEEDQTGDAQDREKEEKDPEEEGQQDAGTEEEEKKAEQTEMEPGVEEEEPEQTGVEADPEETVQEEKESEQRTEDPVQVSREQEDQIPGQDTILNHPEYLPADYPTDAQVDGEPVPAAVEPTMAQRKEECLDLISMIQEKVTMEKYEEAYQAAGQLLGSLEVMKC